MTIGYVITICLIFGVLFFVFGKYTSGNWKGFFQFLCGAIIVVALLVFLLGLFGIRLGAR